MKKIKLKLIMFATLSTATLATSKLHALSCDVSADNWGSGYVVNVTVSNDSNTSINNWQVSLNFNQAPAISGAWNATVSTSNTSVLAKNVDWNGSLAPGQSTSFGVQGTHNGNFQIPDCVAENSGNPNPTPTPVITATPSPTGTPTTPTPTPSVTSTPTGSELVIQENTEGFCAVDGTIDSNNSGFTGSGFANTNNASGTKIQWQVNAAFANQYALEWRYSNSSANSRTATVYVNGVSQGNVNFPTTGSWSSWTIETLNVNLRSGNNEIILQANNSEGLANIDFMRVTGSQLSPGKCTTPTITPTPKPNSAVLAFPGAQGFGRYATGGRGGEVVHVRNLNDSGAGSLRDAISQPNRIVVFDVGGVIKINSRLIFKNNQTIAGQTAPGGGITIYGDGTSFSSANNTIVRYVRFRMGKIGSSGKDTITMANGHDVIWDHCSLSWGRDGNFDLNISSGASLYNLTMQDSIIAQGLQTHSTGGLIQTGGTSIIRSLYIDNNSRNPKARGTLQFINNVIYNWVVSGYILGDTAGRSDGAMLGNYLIAGPETRGGTLDKPTPAYHIYAVDNWYDSNKNGSLDGRLLGQGDFRTATWHTSPSVDFPSVPVMSAQQALQYVINNAGTSHWRDAVDDYLMDELKSWGQSGATISDETSLGLPNVVGNIPGGNAPKDSDNDGMPDAWEIQMGFNPNNSTDAMQDADGDGWVNIEEYINGLVD